MEISEPVPIPETTPHYAGFWLRAAAIIIDFLILAVPIYLLAVLFGENAIHLENKLLEGNIYLYNTARVMLVWLYFSLLESSARQATIGKQALGIYVTDTDGNRISMFRATLRHFTKPISFITLGIGFIMAGFTARKQALQDFMAHTLVLKKR